MLGRRLSATASSAAAAAMKMMRRLAMFDPRVDYFRAITRPEAPYRAAR